MFNQFEKRLGSLLRAFCDNRAGAIETIYSEYNRFVFNTTYAILRNEYDAEDATQNTFIRLYSIKQELLPTGCCSAWLRKVAQNEALMILRKKDTKMEFDESFINEAAGEHVIEHYDEPAIGKMMIDYYFSVLSEEERLIVIYKICGYTHKEISGIMELPQGTVRWKYSESLNKIKKHIISGGE